MGNNETSKEIAGAIALAIAKSKERIEEGKKSVKVRKESQVP